MLVDLQRIRSRYETIAPWRRERAYSQLCALLRSMVLDDGHRFIALVAWSDSEALMSCIEEQRCGPLLAGAIQRFNIEDDARCAGLRAILARMNVESVDKDAVAAGCDRVLRRLQRANIPAILLDDETAPEILVESKDFKAAVAAAPGARIKPAVSEDGTVSTDTSFGGMLAHSVASAPQSYRLTPVGQALYRAVRALRDGVLLSDVYVLASHLRALSEVQRAEFRALIAMEKREATRLDGVVEFAGSLCAVDWHGSLGAKAYAAWLRRCGDLPTRLRARAHGVEASFALPGGISHAIRVLKAGAGRREALARVGSSVAGGVYALFL